MTTEQLQRGTELYNNIKRITLLIDSIATEEQMSYLREIDTNYSNYFGAYSLVKIDTETPFAYYKQIITTQLKELRASLTKELEEL